MAIDVKPVRILIVDDSKPNRKMHGKLIESESDKFRVPLEMSYFADGKEVVDYFQDFYKNAMALDCILLDFIMNDLHGPDCAKILRERFQFKGLILGVSGNVMIRDREMFLEAGADAVLEKPLSISKLFEQFEIHGLIP